MPKKVSFFTLLAIIGVILTVENLRTLKVVCLSWCFLCKDGGEDVDHILLHCDFSHQVWGGGIYSDGLVIPW